MMNMTEMNVNTMNLTMITLPKVNLTTIPLTKMNVTKTKAWLEEMDKDLYTYLVQGVALAIVSGSVHCTLYTVHCERYIVHCTLCTVHYALYTDDEFILYNVQSKL